MKHSFRFSFPIIFIAISVLPMVGCQSKSNPPVEPAAQMVSSSDSAQLKSEPEEKAPTEAPFELESDFALLTLPIFESFGSEPDTWKEVADGIACSGKPRGYLYTQTQYRNFTLRLEYRFPRPANLKDDSKFKGNTGFLVYISGEHKLWPTCIEIQGKNVQMAAIKENGGAEPVKVQDDDAARQQARKPVGEWNALEIISHEGALKALLNGTLISQSEASSLVEGAIGIQSEDHPFEVRRMRIRQD